MELIPDKRKIVGLIEDAERGKLCLPDFQRDFVWARDEVADLIRSILRGYFVGSLLLLRCDADNPPFAPVRLRGAPGTGEPRPELLVLDGQQRLSSLLYALTAPDLSLKDSTKRRWFFVDLDLLLSDPDNDEVVFDRARRELRGLDKPEFQFAQRVLPCTALFSQDRFFAWRDAFEEWQDEHDPSQRDTYRSQWRAPWTKAVGAFQTSEVPLVELPRVDDNDPEAIGRVCAIFEKLNSTGVDLSVYDLLTARLYRSGIRLHALWDSACVQHSRLRTWSDGKADQHKLGVLVLRTLALLRGLDPKPRILIDLSPQDFETDWKAAAAAIERALELIENVGPDGFGVFNKKWLPGFGLVPILAALRSRLESGHLGDAARADLRRWYWSNVFLERYSSAVESKSRKDYLELTQHWFDAGPEPEVFAQAQQIIGAPGFRVRGSASSASSVYSGVFALLAIGQARDWRRREDILLQDLQDHHIFPQAYLKRHGITTRNAVNSIANRTLISDETNRKITDKAPAEYTSDPDVFATGARPELLEPHFISGPALAAALAASEALLSEECTQIYADFIDAREASIIAAVRQVCGVRLDISAEPDSRDASHDEAADIQSAELTEQT